MMSLDPASRAALLALARGAIASSLGEGGAAECPRLPVLDERRGAFVTLTLLGQLRGCIGRIEADAPLRDLIPAVARSAAFSDPRFPALRAQELSIVRVEISLLSVPLPVADPAEVVVGRHGVIVAAGDRRGLLLPQVATEYGWTRDELLSHACAKASLPPDAWRAGGVVLLTFEAEVFGEDAEGG